MFTGIIRAIAPIVEKKQQPSFLRYAIEFPVDWLHHLELGASVAVNGICQTVTAIDNRKVWFEAIEETLKHTTLSQIQESTFVNLERAAKIGDEIGGHLLSGHIYGVATLIHIDKNRYRFKVPNQWMKYFFLKGFIAVDGVSLTLGEVDKTQGEWNVYLIPETLKRTTLFNQQVGSQVNIEIDAQTQAIVETVEKILNHYGKC